MTGRNQARRRSAGDHVFVVEPGPPGSSLLYRLLCLHPDVTYMSSLEHRFPWLTVAATGRLRLRRYSTKLRYWFGDDPDGPPGGALANALIPVPVDAESVCRRDRARVAAGGDAPLDALAIARLRGRFARLRAVSEGRVLATRLGSGSRRLPVIDAVFPQARYLNVVNGHGDNITGVGGSSRAMARIPSGHVLDVERAALVREPIGQMRRVLEFLGLERRRDLEWALKALKLEGEAGRVDEARSSVRDSLAPAGRNADVLVPAPSEYPS